MTQTFARKIGVQRRVCVLAMGGTIAMREQCGGGVVPADRAEALLAGLNMSQDIRIEHRDIALKPSASVDLVDVATLADTVRRLAESGFDGIVVTHGTDTLEETAFALQVMLGSTVPVILTGAMRSADRVDGDGPANLVAAIEVAAHPDARGQGILVVFGDEIHAAHQVRKVHSTRLDAFCSQPVGRLGCLVEGRIQFERTSKMILPRLDLGNTIPVVPLLQAAMDLEAATVGVFRAHAIDALVVAGVGGGHVSEKAAHELEALAKIKPVVITSGVGIEPTLRRTYAYPGGDIDLRRRGLIDGGRWRPNQARILVQLAMSTGEDVASVLSRER